MQITKPVLDDYYTFAGIKYSMHEMNDINKNMEVGVWQLERLKKQFDNDYQVVSAFNMGAGNTRNDVYNISYLCDILGRDRTLQWLKGKTVKSWKGSYRAYYVTD